VEIRVEKWKTGTRDSLPKWVLIVRQKIPLMPQNLSAKFVCPSPKVLNFNEKRLHWASVVRALNHNDMKEYTIESQIINTVIEIRETYDKKIKKKSG
jgi:hypothetical protein